MEPIYGMHLGMVISDNDDPEGRNRVQVWIPHISNTLYTSINSKITNPDFTGNGNVIKDGTLNIKDPLDLKNIDPKIIDNLQLILPWAEYAAPLFGGGSANHNHKTGITSTSNSTTIPGTSGVVTPTIPITSLNMTLTGIKPPDVPLNVPLKNGQITVDDDITLPDTHPIYTAYNCLGVVVSNHNLIGQQFPLTDQNNKPFLATQDVTANDGTVLINKGQKVVLVGFDIHPDHGIGGPNTSITELGPLAAQAVGLTYTPSKEKNSSGGSLYGNVNGSTSFVINQSPTAAAIIANNSDSSNSSGVRSITYTAGSSHKMVAGNIGVAGSAVGSFTRPRAGNKVWVFFLGGDPQKPVYFAQAPNVGDIAAAHG